MKIMFANMKELKGRAKKLSLIYDLIRNYMKLSEFMTNITFHGLGIKSIKRYII
jgi:hypothetical protein